VPLNLAQTETDRAVASLPCTELRDLCIGSDLGIPLAKYPHAQISLQMAEQQQPSFLYASLCVVPHQLS